VSYWSYLSAGVGSVFTLVLG